jgi:hypothetical protein
LPGGSSLAMKTPAAFVAPVRCDIRLGEVNMTLAPETGRQKKI